MSSADRSTSPTRRAACSQQLQRRAVLHHRLAPEQVQRLDAVGAFVDRVDAVVAIALLDRIFAREAITAEHLDRELVRLQRVYPNPRP
jgi:hypothetical protein